MGALSPAEMSEVEELASRHPEIRAEIEEIHNALEQVAVAASVQPRPELKEIILNKISGASESSALSEKAPNVVPLYPEHPRNDDVKKAQPRISSTRNYLLAASIVVAVLGTSLATYFGYRWKQTERELTRAIADRDVIVQQYNDLKHQINQVVADVKKLENPENVVVKLKGLDVAPNAVAVVYWDPATKLVYLTSNHFPAPPPGKQYQLWAIDNGKPIDAGVFDVARQEAAVHDMKRVESAEAFAVTLEPQGGVPIPTGDMYVLGKL